MTAKLSRSFVATVLAVTLVPLPGLAAQQPGAASPTPPTDAAEPPAEEGSEGNPIEGAEGAEGVPAEGEAPLEAAEEKPEEKPEEPAVTEPEGPERPPEPTLGNGKFKAKGTGLMISGGVLLGLGVAGIISTVLLTRCTELDNSFGCKNKQNATFAVPATGTVALLGAVLLVVGLTYRTRYKRWESWDPNKAKTAFVPTFTANGVGVRF